MKTTDKRTIYKPKLVNQALISSFFLLMAPVSGQSQTGFTDVLSKKLAEYARRFPREEIYIHTDRQDYIAGEDIWFKIYAFDRQILRPLTGNGIVYFEILNPENRPVVQKRIGISDGAGPGYVSLSDTISSGIYMIRAYTNWMKNFMPYNCFSKNIYVYNPLKNRSFKNKRIEVETQPGNGKVLQQPGLALNVIRDGDRNAVIEITSSPEYRSAKGVTHYLSVQTRGSMNFASPVSITGDITDIEIRGNLLTPGINQITLFNISGRPVCEKYIYTPFNSAGMEVSSPESYNPRDRVAASFEAEPGSFEIENDLKASVSVVPAGSDSFPDIADYLVFGSEFGTLPGELFHSDLDEMESDTLDAILRGLKSNWIDWEGILSGKYPDITYKKEKEDHFLYGRLLNKNTQKPDSGHYVFLSIPGKNAYFQYALTNGKGEFCFALPLDENLRDLIIQPEDPERNNNLEIENSFSLKYPVSSATGDNTEMTVTGELSRFGVNYQVMKIYTSADIGETHPQVVLSSGRKRFYGKPDIELVMDDYIKLPVMQEVFFELMPGVSLKKRKSDYEIAILDPVENKFFDRPPVLFADGVIIKDPATIANLDPELVEKVDAIKARYFVGDYMFYGLVNVITRSGDFSHFTLPDYAVRIRYRAVEETKSFSSPDYSSAEKTQSRLPDFRNTLYWNPELKFNSEGRCSAEFYASDIKSDYKIVIQGVSKKGHLFSAEKIIRVQ
jgi:hypothetical protein